MVGIYLIKNTINNKVYIGQAQDIESRWKEHRRKYNLPKNKNIILYKAFKKYGIENFTFEVIEECVKEELNERETFYIKFYNAYAFQDNPSGYNMTREGGSCRGCVHNKEQNKKHSKIMKGRTPMNKGVPMSEEQKKKLREIMLGKTLTEEHKIKISKSQMGKEVSDETKDKIREFQKTFRQTEEGSTKGGKNPRAKKVICEGIIYDCVKDCAKAYGVTYGSMKAWLQGKCRMKQEFIDKGLSFLEEK